MYFDDRNDILTTSNTGRTTGTHRDKFHQICLLIILYILLYAIVRVAVFFIEIEKKESENLETIQ